MVKKSKILVIYGYHPEETFAADVGLEISKTYRENVLVEKFDREADKRGEVKENFFSFLKEHLPLDYAVDLHDNLPASQEVEKLVKSSQSPESSFPRVMLGYDWSKIDNAVNQKLLKYCNAREYIVTWGNIPQKYPGYLQYVTEIEVEFIPYILNKSQGVDFVSGLIKILSDAYPRSLENK